MKNYKGKNDQVIKEESEQASDKNNQLSENCFLKLRVSHNTKWLEMKDKHYNQKILILAHLDYGGTIMSSFYGLAYKELGICVGLGENPLRKMLALQFKYPQFYLFKHIQINRIYCQNFSTKKYLQIFTLFSNLYLKQ